MSRRVASLALACLGSATFAHAQPREARSVDRPLDVATIADTAVASLVRAEAAFMRDVAERRLDGWAAAFADDAANFPAGGGITRGRDAVRGAMARVFADTSVRVRWHPVHATVARSGDLGYTFGYFRWDSRDGAGQPGTPSLGRFVTIWRRGAGGRWEVVLDTGTNGKVPDGFFDR